MPNTVKHLVHCSGYSLAEGWPGAKNRRGEQIEGRFGDWEYVCMGNPERGLLGRIPMTLRVAAFVQAERIIWSTGAVFLNNESEAEVMLRIALERGRDFMDPEHLRRISAIEEESKDTFTSIQQLEAIIKREYSNSKIFVHLVTSANHAPRVARDAASVFDDDLNVVISVVPCHTSYGNKTLKDIVVRDLGE